MKVGCHTHPITGGRLKANATIGPAVAASLLVAPYYLSNSYETGNKNVK
jgi:hypothetical protein